MKIIRKSVVYQGKGPALFPGLARAANGDLLVSFCTTFDCLPGGQAYLLRSSDDGRTWSKPELILGSRKPGGCINLSVGLTTLRNGTVLYPCCDARITRKWDQHDADLFILRSEDHGQTWTGRTPVLVETKEPFAYGAIIELKNGEVLCPIWGKHRHAEPWSSGILRSPDEGMTWGEHRTIAYDSHALPGARTNNGEIHCAGFNETSLLELPDGQVLAIIRQQGVHGGLRELYRSISSDKGRTWSAPTPLDLWGTSPSLHLTSSGTIMLGYRNHRGNPQGLTAPGVAVSFSPDAGQTWTGHLLLEDPKGYRYSQEFEAGYPAFLEMQDGSILVVFYSFNPFCGVRYLAANLLLEQPPTTSMN